jgi:hypothetical protein
VDWQESTWAAACGVSCAAPALQSAVACVCAAAYAYCINSHVAVGICFFMACLWF